MGKILPAVFFFWICAALTDSQEFRRMPELRGQSFGLENFLLQPFSIAAQAEETATKRRGVHPANPYNVEFQVRNDFDMKKLVPTGPRAPLIVNHEEPSVSIKTVHEFVDQPVTTSRIRQRLDGRPQFERRQMITAETRRPLERPSEFQLTPSDSEPSPPPERIRKRVMKRRRKKPTTPIPESSEEEEDKEIQLPKLEEGDEVQTNVFPDNTEPAEYKTSFFIDHTKATPERKKQEKDNEIIHSPRKPETNKRQRQPEKVKGEEKPENTFISEQIVLPDEDRVVGEATIEVAHQELPLRVLEEKHTEKEEASSIPTPTTETPQEPTHRLKTLLKQQNGQLSLSELLQTQNLSLSDFLKGNPGALSVLGGNKPNIEKTTPKPETETEKLKVQTTRTHVPKISPKSRPFSKPSLVNNTKPIMRRPTTEEPIVDLPKKLDIIEVTSDRPAYNGFAPKNPRTRLPFAKTTPSPETDDKNLVDGGKTNVKLVKDINIDPEIREDEREIINVRSSTTARPPVYRLTTLGQSTIGENRVVPKRYGDYKPKLRVDRRKFTTEGAIDIVTTTEAQEIKHSPSTEEIELKVTYEPKNRVRIPFMSVNNPEISVILPNKKQNTTTDKPKERFNFRDRINLFKRINSDEKTTLSDVSLETKPLETTEAATTAQSSTTTEVIRTTVTKAQRTTTTTTTTTEPTRASVNTVNREREEERKETSDEIVELLKMGNNAQRLERLLATRNMTINELLEKRARSSKQPNVTNLFENKTENHLNHKTVEELNDNFHPTTEKVTTTIATTRKPPTTQELPRTKTDSRFKEVKPAIGRYPHETNNFDELFVDESIIRPIKISADNEEQREGKSYESKAKNSHRVQLNLAPGTEGKPKHPMPIWNVDEKSIYNRNPYGYPTYDLNKNLAGNRIHNEGNRQQESIREEETIILETVPNSQDSNQNLKNNINEILKEQIEVVKDVHGEEKTFIPPAVKSAIIASGVVMGIALVVFVAIFAACGWKQRQFRLRARSSILNDSLSGSGHKIKRTGTLSPISFKRTALYKKSIEFEDSDSSISGSSNTSSYLWNTLKHTFQSRNSTLKNRQEKEEKIQERESRSRRNTLTREDDRSRRATLPQDDLRRDSVVSIRDQELPRRNTLTRDDFRRDSLMSRRELSREDTRRSSGYRDDTRRLSSIIRDAEHCSFRKIDPERNIIQTSVNFKRGGFNGSSRHFDNCDHFQ